MMGLDHGTARIFAGMDAGEAGHGTRGADGANGTAGRLLLHEQTTGAVLGGFFAVYTELGSGFLESVYARALAVELRLRGLIVEREAPVRVFYKGIEVGFFRADSLVERAVLVEVKAVERLISAHEQQVRNYLKATTLEVALLLNFGPRPTFKRFILSDRAHHP